MFVLCFKYSKSIITNYYKLSQNEPNKQFMSNLKHNSTKNALAKKIWKNTQNFAKNAQNGQNNSVHDSSDFEYSKSRITFTKVTGFDANEKIKNNSVHDSSRKNKTLLKMTVHEIKFLTQNISFWSEIGGFYPQNRVYRTTKISFMINSDYH